MARVEYSTTARLPVDAIWDFVREIDNWAPLLTGYQSHEKESDDDSVWVLKGDVGAMTRTLKFRVHVTEWAGPERVTFRLQGLNEQMEGDGLFLMEAWETGDAAGPAGSADAGPAGSADAARRGNVFQRLLEAVMRFFFRRRHGRAERAADADAGPGEGMARLTFRLEVRPGGPMGPMINPMIQPAMKVAAEDLANRIIGHLEREAGGAPPRS